MAELLTPVRMLLVHPSPVFYRIVPEEMRQVQGIAIRGVKTGQEAIDLAKLWTPEWFVISIRLQDMSWQDLVTQVQNQYDKASIAIMGQRNHEVPINLPWIDQDRMVSRDLRRLVGL